MESFIDLLRSRRSIRKYEARVVEKEKVETLVETMLRSPSSRGLNPWEFVVVDDADLIGKLSEAKPHGATFVKGAPLAIVVYADPQKSDVWIEDTSIASILLHLAATDLGLGSCWVQIRLRENAGGGSAEDYVKRILNIDESKVVEAIIAIGYPAESKGGHPESKLLMERVRNNLDV